MARRRREYEDDDGRTIADMSDVSRPSLMGRRAPERPEDSLSRESSGGSDDYIPPEDRKWYVLGALKAAKKRKAVYTPRAFYRFYRFLCRILPDALLIRLGRT